MTEKLLTMNISGGSSMFRAECPELRVSYTGESVPEARRGLYFLARNEVDGILSSKEVDQRKEVAGRVHDQLQRTGRISRVFKIVK